MHAELFSICLLVSFRPDTKIDKDTTCTAVGCPGTDLKDLNTYFSEYVLEDSNASNYFNVYVAGFLIAPEVHPMNNTNSSVGGANGSDIGEKTVSTVWYSNEVRENDCCIPSVIFQPASLRP